MVKKIESILEAVKWQIIIQVVFLFCTLMLPHTENVLHSSQHEKAA